MRTAALWLIVFALGAYAWKDWYKSLCGLILLMAVIRHPDMPETVFGIQGLNPWNLLLLNVVLAWWVKRRGEGLRWDLPSHLNFMLLASLSVVLVGFFRMLVDPGAMPEFMRLRGGRMPSTLGLWSDYLINTIKWAVPGLLLFDGCRSRGRFTLAVSTLMAVYVILAIQVLKWMPLQAAIDGGDLAARSGVKLRKEVGYHRTDLSVMLAGASWALFSTKELFKGRGRVFLILAGSLLILLAQALTAGRGGYLAWVAVGLLMCLLRYRKYLLIVPPLAIALLAYSPWLMERITTGLAPADESSPFRSEGVDANELTAGRSVAWPLVVEAILEAPVFGHGREAMKRRGIATRLFLECGEGAPHPHNAYLEMLLDNGFTGFVLVVPFFFLVFRKSLHLFRDRTSDVCVAAGGVALALVGAQLVGSLTGQTFYPREASVGMWCSMGLVMRMYVVRMSAVSQGRDPSEFFG